MFSWLQKDIPIAASVFFRGTWPSTKESFLPGLAARGVEVAESSKGESDSVIWSMGLRHAEWGEADLLCMREMPMPPEIIVDWDGDLIDSERAAIKACGTGVSIMVQSSRKHLLRDRKNALFFLHAVMGEEGVAGLDHVSQKFWSRGALEAEVAHKADADVQSLFTVHYVAMDEKNRWLHTHGLAEIGLDDFDILNADDFVAQPGSDVVRAIAHAIMEGNLKAGGAVEVIGGKAPLAAVAASEFMAKGEKKWTAIREEDGDHREDRVVICDPPGKGFLGFGKSAMHPASILMKALPDDTLIHFSNEATELMAERARLTYPLLRSMVAELAELELPALVKIGYAIDGAKEDEREHLWFQIHEARENEVDATLLNQPFHIARMKEGDRGTHSIAQITDWQIMTPVGPINPRQTLALRFLREAMSSGAFKKRAGEDGYHAS